jgi:Flp pilus assembly protein TadG
MTGPLSNRLSTRRASQRGAVAIIVGLSMAVLVGMVGLAIDGGRLYLNKTELQNAADSCALSASYELTGAPTIAQTAFDRAVAAGTFLTTRNSVEFQSQAIAAGQVAIDFSSALSGPWTGGTNPPANSRYVRCTITRTGIAPFLMQVLGVGNQTVSARATATLAPAQTNCAVPMALCAQGPAPDYGYVVGNWYGMDFSQTGSGNNSTANYTGNFRWIDYNPGAATPGCSGGGAQELACLLQGTGQCSLPAPISGSCSTSGNANAAPGCVGQTGAINALEDAYNSRFGLYRGGGGGSQPSVSNAPPDFAGYAYSTENWTLGRDAFGGSVAGQPNFRTARSTARPTENINGVNPSFFSNPYSASTTAIHRSNGADRRLVVVPIVDCANFSGGQHAPVRAYACVLLLDPYRRQGNNIRSRLEYLGRSNAAGSPCATSGIAGNSSSQGPQVPALVQ